MYRMHACRRNQAPALPGAANSHPHGTFKATPGRSFPLLALRGFCGFASMSLWYLCLTLLPLSDAMSLSFVSPVRLAAAENWGNA